MKNNSQLKYILIGILCLVILFGFSQIKPVYVSNDVIDVNITEPRDDRGVEVSIQDYTGEIESYFLINVQGSGSLTSDSMEFSNNITVDDSTGCVVGNSLYVYNGVSAFQALITDITGNTISFTPVIDKDFMAGESYFECGSTNMAVDGSVTPVIFSIRTPYNASWDITTLTVNFIDNKEMDASMFGSRTALTNGLLIRRNDRDYNNFFMIYNNNGFVLRGFKYLDVPKTPSGEYMISFGLDFDEVYKSVARLNGYDNDSIEIIVNDDLSSQERIVSAIGGHRTDE